MGRRDGLDLGQYSGVQPPLMHGTVMCGTARRESAQEPEIVTHGRPSDGDAASLGHCDTALPPSIETKVNAVRAPRPTNFGGSWGALLAGVASPLVTLSATSGMSSSLLPVPLSPHHWLPTPGAWARRAQIKLKSRPPNVAPGWRPPGRCQVARRWRLIRRNQRPHLTQHRILISCRGCR